jgi:hypothetical protein
MAEREIAALSARDAEAGICTETLARLYLQQGFVARALAIYRRLAQEQPDNAQLQERLRTLEQQLALGALGQDAVAPHTSPDLAVDTASVAPHDQGDAVIAQLERWLHYLQRPRQPQEHP